MNKKNIVITGANRGIGFQAALRIAECGHRVILTGRDSAKLKVAAQKIPGDVIVQELDVTEQKSIDSFCGWLKKENYALDVLINNAGSVFDQWQSTSENPLYSSVEVLRQTLELNLIGVYATTAALFPFFNTKSRVDLINISSGMGAIHDMGTGSPAYRISKTALNGLTAYLNASFDAMNKKNIYTNSVCPGWVRTDLGGAAAPRSLDEGVVGILWLVQDEPDIRGQFIRDRQIIEF